MNDELRHYGVLGMKWGVKRYQNKDGSLTNAGEKRYNFTSSNKENKWGISGSRLKLTTKSGDLIELKDQPSSAMTKFLAKHIKSVAREQDKTAVYDIKDSSGKNVGDITLYKESKDSVNVVWITTSKSVRGRGYGTAVMKAAIDIAKDTGAKKVTLEVPGSSPDARHIYEKLGFREVASPDRNEDDVWGGLTNMELNLDSLKHSFSTKFNGLIPVSLNEKKKYAKFLKEEIELLSDSSNSSELYHYGVLGMRWGVRRYQNEDGSLTDAGRKRYDRDIVDNQRKKKDNRIDTSRPDPERWVREDTERSKKLLDAGSALTKDLSNAERISSSRSVKKRMDLSKMSDDELRRAISREQLERQYNDLFSESTKISKGRQVVRNILDETGATLAIGSSALGIALAIKQLRG